MPPPAYMVPKYPSLNRVNLCYRYIDDLIVFNNKKCLDYLKEIYSSQLTVEKTSKSDHPADYLALTFIIG